MKKTIIIICTIITVIVLSTYLIFKINLLKKYDISNIDSKNDSYEKFLKAYSTKSIIKINNNNKIEQEYLTFKNLQLKDIINNNFQIINKKEQKYPSYDSITYELTSKKTNETANLVISDYDSFCKIFTSKDLMIFADITKNDESDIDINAIDRKKFLNKHNITNDLELFEYLAKTKNKKSNIFTSVEEIKGNYLMQCLASISLPKVNNISIIKGKYNGYVLYVNDKIQEVNILYNDRKYILSLRNMKLTDEELREFLNSIEIK